MPLDDATWALVREAYCAKILKVSAILKEFGLSANQLAARRIAESWPVREGGVQRKSKSLDVSCATFSLESPQFPTTRQARTKLILRLYKAIDLKLTQMEKHMENASETSSADHERDTRAISGLVRSFEHVTELNADLTRTPSKSADHPAAKRAAAADTSRTSANANTIATTLGADPAGTERMRLDIAQRLELILQKQAPPSDAG